MKKFWPLLLVLLLTSLSYADITPLPDPPSRTSPSTFAAKADAFLGALPAFATEANQLASDVNDDEVAAAASAAAALGYSNIALSSANFAGDWDDQAGAAAPPYSVWHAGNYWQLVSAVLDVSATEPGQTADWRVIGTPVDEKFLSSYLAGGITAALADIGADVETLVIDASVADTVTIPRNVLLRFVPGSLFTGSVTIATPGQIIAPPDQAIFGTASDITFQEYGTVYLDWYSPYKDCDVVAGTGTETQVQINNCSHSISTAGGVMVWSGGDYLMGPGYVICYSNQTWKGNGSTLRLARRSSGTNYTVNMIHNYGFGSTPIANFKLYDLVLWGDGEENGVADNFSQAANLALYKASGCIIENVTAKYHGGGNITMYGDATGPANVLRNVVAGPGWGLNAISVAPGKWIWENVEVVPDKYAGANPGIDIDIEDTVSGVTSSTHWMTNVRSRNLIFADRTTAAAGTFKHSVYMNKCKIGPSYKALSFIATNNLTANVIDVKDCIISDTTVNGYGLWIDNLSGGNFADLVIDSPYAMGFNHTVSNNRFANIKVVQKDAGDYGVFAYPSATLNFTNNIFSNCDLGDIFMGGLSNTGNMFKACEIDDAEFRNVTTTANVFDEATKVKSYTLSSGGHVAGQHIRTRKSSMVCEYDFALHGGADSTIQLSEFMPENAVVTNAGYEVITAFTSGGGATVSIGVQGTDQAGIQTALAYNNAAYTVGFHDGIPDGTAANFCTKATAPRKISITIAGAALTAGKVVIWVDYVWTDS